MKEYFGKGVCCIYLDQFAASNLFDEPPSQIWSEICELIFKKHEQGKVICPVPFEHMLESSNKTQERAYLIDQSFGKLSNGLAFLPEADAAANCIISLIRNLPLNSEVFCGQLRFNETLKQSGAFDGFKTRHSTLRTQIDESTGGVNELREILAEKKFPRKVMEPFYQGYKLMQVQVFAKRLAELITKGSIISEGEKFSNGSVIKWTDLLLQLLLIKHKLTYEESLKLHELLTTSGFDLIPPMDVRWSLSGNIIIQHKKETLNDHIDIMRLSTGLPPSDLLFTDKQRKHELEQTGLAKKYKTEVFSGTPADLDMFYNCLKEIG